MSVPLLWRAQLWKALPWLILVVAIAIGYQTMRPPSPAASEAATDFSADRAFAHVQAIAVEPHPMGSTAGAVVRAYITDTLGSMGIAVEAQTTNAPNYFYGGDSVPVVNVIGRIAGAADTGAIALVAHYDTVPTTTGANDNSAAVGTLLETARALLAGPPLDNDVMLIFTDGEEPSPRFGANAFVSGSSAVGEIGMVVNLEATGRTGASLLIQTSGPEAWLIDGLDRSQSPPAGFSFLTETSRLLGEIGTDFDVFSDAGIPGLHFAYLHDSSSYHTAGDNIDSVDLGSLQHHGLHALETARRFGFYDFSQATPDGGKVFFSVGSFLVHYSSRWAIPMMLVALAGAATGFTHRFRHGDFPTELQRVGVTFAGLLFAAVAGTLVWMLIAAARSMLGLIEGYLYFGAIAAAVGGGMLWIASRFPALAPGRHAPVLLWLALTVLTAFLGVGFSYLFAWPASAMAVASWWKADGLTQETLRFALIAFVTLLLVVPAIDVFLQLAYPRPGNPDSSIPGVVVIPIFFTLLVAGFLRSIWPRPLAN